MRFQFTWHCALILLFLTLPGMAKPSCGTKPPPGPLQLYRVSGYSWDKDEVTWELVNTHKSFTRVVTLDIVRAATAVWTDSCGLRFREVSANENPDITIEFVDLQDTWGLASSDNVINSNYTGVDITIDQTVECNRNGLSDILKHEIGHAIGLNHPKDSKEKPIMIGKMPTKPDSSKSALAEDHAAAWHVYGPRFQTVFRLMPGYARAQNHGAAYLTFNSRPDPTNSIIEWQVVLVKKGTALESGVPLSRLGGVANPPDGDIAALFRSIAGYAEGPGQFEAGLPNCHYWPGPSGAQVVGFARLGNQNLRHDVPYANVQPYNVPLDSDPRQSMRGVHAYATANGFAAGFPTFHHHPSVGMALVLFPASDVTVRWVDPIDLF